jgi:ABC-type transport system involved in multi-copper enzyme maturation permease subunit
MIGLFPSLSLFVFREQIKLVVDSAMATTMVFGLVAAVLCASHTISREMRNGTVLLLLSKPVYRWNFILAKICGIIAALTVFVFICNTASLIAVRVAKDQFQLDFTALYIYFGIIFVCAFLGALRNFFYQTSFASTAIFALLVILPFYTLCLNFVPVHGRMMPLRWDIVPAFILLFFCVWCMGTVTVVFSTRLDMVANLCVCSIIFILGLVSNYFLGKSSGVIATFFYALLPNWQFFWLADALASNQKIPLTYIFLAFIYTVLYMSFCTIWAMAAFHNRELAKDAVKS